MNLHKLIFTNNACYKAGRRITPKGIMVHSTGANNPWLKRYVGPDDGLLGKNQYNNHWNQPMDREVCVHAFIGKLADGTVATYQTLPWDYRGWHCAGSGNDTHISFEICEDGLTDAAYLDKVYNEAVDLCVYLCELYGLTEQDIICHCEGHDLGIASNHGDVLHWWPKHGKNMDTFRAAVKDKLGGSVPDTPVEPEQPGGKIKAGDLVTITGTKYYSGQTIPAWVRKQKWYVYEVSGDRAVINKNESGANAIMSPVRVSDLALATLGLVCAAANTVASDAEYWVNGSVGREAHIAAAYETLGFEDALFYNYDLDTGRAGDFVGYSLARKTLTLNGQRTTLVALVLRGGGYGGEWASNFHIGDTSAHTGFVTPVAAVFASLKAYLARAGQGGAFKLWLGGYSRGSIIANLLAAKIARELPQLGRENIYAYGFAVPAALTAADRPDLQQDFDANHAPDGTLLENWPESNIFSIISSGDAVARVLPAAWGYHRNGCDRFLPATRNAEELADLDALGAEFGPTPLVISSLATAEDTSALINIVAKFCVSRENFHQKYEAAIMDMIQCAFLRSEKEVVDGYILSDGEIVERLQSLSHMKEIDYWQIVGSVWAASTMSRPILERYGQNVPLLARQILIPVLAVGLCYGIETDVVQMVAQYIIRLLTARGELDSVLRAAFCHHPENYISLMEYYTPEEHGMEPFTRK